MGARQVPRRPLVNEVGDLVLTEVEQLRAVTDPRRRELFDRVRRQGPATAEELGGAEADLQALEEAGFIDRGADGRWSTDARGIYFEIPTEEGDAQRAARELSASMIGQYADVPGTWAREDEPRLAAHWSRAAGLFNARVALTPAEAETIQEELERVLTPYTTRAQPPEGAGPVRVLAFFLPEAP